MSNRPRVIGIVTDAGVAVAVVVGMLALRWPSILAPFALNPDEAQLGAGALRVLRHGVGWTASDGTTSGPLNPLPLLLPAVVGVEPSLVTGRIVAALLLAASVFIVYSIAKLWLSRWVAVPFAGAVGAYLALAPTADFTHYSSELLSVALSLTGMLILVYLVERRPAGRRAIVLVGVVGLLAGALPFAKIQTAPIGVMLAVAALVWVLIAERGRRVPALLSLAAGGVLTAVLLLVPLVATGELASFTTGYLGLAGAYVSTPLTPVEVFGLAATDRWMLGLILGSVVSAVLAVAVSLAGRGRGWKLGIGGWFLLALVLVYPIVGFVAVSFPGRGFAHYIQLLWPPLAVLAAYAWSRATIALAPVRRAPFLMAAGVVVAFAVAVPFGDLGTVRDRLAYTQSHLALDARRGDALAVFEPGAETLVWGWMPQWYLASGGYPAARETMNEFQIRHTPNQHFFRDRLIDDLQGSPPAIIVDAVVPGSFGFDDPAIEGIGSFDELSDFVADGYQAVGSGLPCPRVYLRADVADAFAERYVPIASVDVLSPGGNAAGTGALTDLQVLHAGCADSWGVDDRSSATLQFGLTETENVSEVWVLGPSMPNGRLSELRASIVVGDRTVARDVVIEPWPNWTRIDLGSARADEIRLELSGRPGAVGLTEVAVFRR